MSTTKEMALVSSKMAQLELLMLESSGDELSPVVVFELGEIAQNVDLCAEILVRCDSAADYFKNKAKAFAAVAKAYEKSQSYLKLMIKDDMIAHGIDELPGNDTRFKLVKMKSKLVIEDHMIEEAFQKLVPYPDKEKIEEALVAGLEVRGAHLEEVKALRTYMNKGKINE